ncbi:hypothetical protein NDU88_005535 [Pleurodeles waltl]|uniref:Uncharacterized protein n=1 Tax=Pleurodeles waltl TaxID=8319 RepID=A0AAV7RLC2_PLEWA|nr:hypothetical protein NDU88_005535 [Pleurodeles waltl]
MVVACRPPCGLEPSTAHDESDDSRPRTAADHRACGSGLGVPRLRPQRGPNDPVSCRDDGPRPDVGEAQQVSGP